MAHVTKIAYLNDVKKDEGYMILYSIQGNPLNSSKYSSLEICKKELEMINKKLPDYSYIVKITTYYETL